jgi:hypothetical protein
MEIDQNQPAVLTNVGQKKVIDIKSSVHDNSPIACKTMIAYSNKKLKCTGRTYTCGLLFIFNSFGFVCYI